MIPGRPRLVPRSHGGVPLMGRRRTVPLGPRARQEPGPSPPAACPSRPADGGPAPARCPPAERPGRTQMARAKIRGPPAVGPAAGAEGRAGLAGGPEARTAARRGGVAVPTQRRGDEAGKRTAGRRAVSACARQCLRAEHAAGLGGKEGKGGAIGNQAGFACFAAAGI